MDENEKVESFNQYRRRAIKAARDLRYGDDVVNDIKNADTESEIISILADARRNK